MTSAYPFTGECGKSFVTTIRGANLGARRLCFWKTPPEAAAIPFTATIESADAELVKLHVQVDAGTKAGRYLFRLITPKGVSNTLPLFVVSQPVSAEPEGSHETPAHRDPRYKTAGDSAAAVSTSTVRLTITPSMPPRDKH